MLLNKKGFPDEDSLVLVTVTKVNPNSVFCVLDHHEKRTGLIHISEISPGRIRNIRDYVVEGKRIVCKVLRVDKERGHIDLSLRRVTEIQKRNFNEGIKQEQKAEKLMLKFAEQNKISKIDLNKVVEKIAKEYEFVFDFFSDLVENNIKASEVIDSSIADKLEEFVKEKIQPEKVQIKGKLKLSLFQSDGVELIKDLLSDVADDSTKITYLGSGTYSLLVESKDFKDAEKIIKQKVDKIEELMEKDKGVFAFERQE